MKTLKFFVMVMVLVGAGLFETNASGSGTDIGKATVQYSSANISPCTSGSSYDDPQFNVDVVLNLPKGFSFEVQKFAPVENFKTGGWEQDKGDEIDVALWYATKVGDDFDLKLRLKWISYPKWDSNRGSDLVAEDVFVSKKYGNGVAEIRAEIFHPAYSFDNVGLSLMPSVSHTWNIGTSRHPYYICDRFGLQWNSDYGPLSDEVINVQAGIGLKSNIGKWSFSPANIMWVHPLTKVPEGDPRKPEGDFAFTASVSRSF